ncbi:TrbG/VirB9 family P-type conjugative transfer protein [Sphingomonas sp. JC676]|uniref:TrbG/VirB9 family P-type conjugative transfer protein n=1 Tax=Sphingomonas sp. JC676 TaxID=2768065 RepID=UPI0016576D2A|nr:TrbG/VirB9 family P-type conjugative transfer protein [Sphingomonas sp. JC676]MBC9032999.1 TrbG/VirB9 family P-type conjugative transfer protein [Sphingomonas sp. JC676]
MRIALVLLLAPLAAQAQVLPRPGLGNPHVQSVTYADDQVVTLQAAPGYQLTVEFAADERIENVALGDSGAWQVSANKRGDRLFLKLIQPGVATNMVVITDTRAYSFDLAPLGEAQPDMAYTVRFLYPSPVQAGAAAENAKGEAPLGRYRLRGVESLRPAGMHDDGTHTYIEWPVDRPLPAIYAINDSGNESLVNGMMRDGRIVIDSVQPKLVFRIDNRSATATRLPVQAP